MQSNEIRAMFLDFFAAKGHLLLPSFSLIPQNDPTLLLIGAGMAPLKPYFTGERKPPHPRVATCQRCVRTPDIERVGLTGRHATFFEMLGNFSFGDYFKEEAIAYAWELVTQVYRLPLERLWVSIYEEDEEAFAIWNLKIGLPADRIVRLGKKDNFWEIGSGPCGPCSEIYYDLGPEAGCGGEDCAVGCDCDRYLEIWNLVFTQFNKEPSGEYTVLKQKNIDTGAGLERLATVLQGKKNFFETDLIQPIYRHFREQAGGAGSADPDETSLRIVTEHSRGITFLAADGVVPANEGRGYVLRRLLRRAARHGKLLGMEGSFLSGAAPLIISLMETAYPELTKRRSYITRVLQIEEGRFHETLAQGMEILEGYIHTVKQEGTQVFPGAWAFKLYDTFGFPLELTEEILAEQGLQLDSASFRENLLRQQEQARLARARIEQADQLKFKQAGELTTVFTGYDLLEDETELLLILKEGAPQQKLLPGESADIFLDRTPFYAEAGGQTGDAGIIRSGQNRFVVENTVFTPSGQIVHQGRMEEGSLSLGNPVTAQVDEARRRALCRSHTATHLLHRVLQEQLGGHVHQAGSLVAPDRLRFDFTHFSALTREELRAVENRVNELIRQNLPISVAHSALSEARQAGATALFTEKYADQVRVVTTGDYSQELCGGTHAAATGEIGLFKLISEEGIGSGIRRVEAFTGQDACISAAAESERLERVALALHTTTGQLEPKLEELLDEIRILRKTNQELKQRLAGFEVISLLSRVQQAEGINVLSAAVEAEDAEELRLLIDRVKEKLTSAVVVLGAIRQGKVLLAGAVSADLIEQGIYANKIIAQLARRVGGGGGGKPELAQAGGKDPAALPEALNSVTGLVRQQVEAVSK